MHNSGQAGRARKHRKTYGVPDADLFREVIADAVTNQHGGSLLAGVKATNQKVEQRRRLVEAAPAPEPKRLNYATAWRLRHEPPGRLQGSTFAWLKLFVGPERQGRLEEAVLSPLGQWLLARHEAWERSVLDRLARDHSDSILQAALDASGARAGRIGLLLREMLRAYPEEFQRFHDRTTSHREGRIQLALLHLVEPFLDTGPLDLERSWEEEMGPADRKRYVYLTLQREALLLDRSPDLQRAQEIAARIREDHSRYPKLGIPPLG